MNVWEGGQMDKIEKFNEATIQHGTFNNRLYIMKFPATGTAGLVKDLNNLAKENGYTKIFGKIPKMKLPLFLRQGFKVEAAIPKFYRGRGGCVFVSKFLDRSRAVYDPAPLKKFRKVLDNYHFQTREIDLGKVHIEKLTKEHAEAITGIYKEVFETYPFPIHDKEYIRRTMDNDVWYFGVFLNGKLCSVSSAEVDVEGKNAEMTDFAVTGPSRGKGHSKYLLRYMEQEMNKMKIKTAYTIARLNSIPMNKTFLGAGYSYAGTLINNTNISGGIESMNVLYKYI
jgi:putative beta-lysine N-acetyltransferase